MEVFEQERQTLNRIRQQPAQILQALNPTGSVHSRKLSNIFGLLDAEATRQSSRNQPLTDLSPKFSGMSEVLYSSGWANPVSIHRDHVVELFVRMSVSMAVLISLGLNADFKQPIAFIFLVASLFFVETSLRSIIKNSHKHQDLLRHGIADLLHAICYSLFFLGTILYFSELISGLTLFACSLLYCLFGIGVNCYPAAAHSYFSHRKLVLFEALQVMLITLKLCKVSPLGWTLTLTPLGVSAFYFTVLGVFMKILLMMSILLRGLPVHDAWLIKATLWESWDFLTTGISYLLFIKGIGLHYDQKILQSILKNQIVLFSDSSCLFLSCGFLLAVSAISLTMCLCWKASIIDYLRKVLYKEDLMKEIIQDELNPCHQTSLAQISPTYFIKQSLSKATTIDKTPFNEVCVFCCDRETNIVIDPCGHGGICRECALNYFKDRDRNCPFCKQTSEEVFVIEFDRDQQIFKTKAQIIFNF
jgi:hypothetical protein